MLARFHAVTGLCVSAPLATALPIDFRARPVPAPQELLASVRLGRRAANALRRYLAGGGDCDGEWTYGRLMEIPGFGMAGLVEALEGLVAGAHPIGPPPPRTLNDELARLPAAQRGPQRLRTLPLLERAMAIISDMLPASELHIQKRLRQEHLLVAPIGLDCIERAARFSLTLAPFVVLRRKTWIVALRPESRAVAEKVCTVTIRAMSTRGLSTIAELSTRVGADAPFITRMVTAHPAFQWLDRREGWFWLRTPVSVLLQSIERAVQLRGESRLADLLPIILPVSSGLEVPPLRVLRRLCRQVPRFVVRGRTLRLARQERAA